MRRADEIRLVERARQEDWDAFSELVRRHQRMVYNLALEKVSRHHDAEEIVQTVFLNAWKGLPSFRGEAAFSTWLYRLTRNASADLLRARQRRGEAVSLDDPDFPDVSDPRPGPEEAFQAQARREALWTAIDSLPEASRQILLLREAEGLSYEEMAQVLGIPVGTVRSRLARARLSLRELLSHQGNFLSGEPSNEEKGGEAP